MAVARSPHGGTQVKVLEWVSSSGPPPIVLESFVKVDAIKTPDAYAQGACTITYYFDHIDDAMWKAQQDSRGNVNWYISESIR